MMLYMFYCVIELLDIYFIFNNYELMGLQLICLILIPFICNLFYNYVMTCKLQVITFYKGNK